MLVHPPIDRESISVLLNPYPGLRPFAETEQRLFFGRSYQVGEILQRLERTSFAVVTGGSGSGKSSIVNAGVIPALRKKHLASRGDFWLAATFSPKDRPFKNLASELAKLIEPLGDQSDEQLVQDVEQTLLETNSLAGFFERYETRIILEEGQAPESRTSANLLIFCDQFEEIFREQNRDNPEAAQLVDLIVEAYTNQNKYPRLFLMIGMRSEDLHRCAAFIDLPNVINGSVFLTRRLDEAEIVSAIVEPMRLSLRLRGIVPEQYNQVEFDPWPFDADVLHRLNSATAAMASDPDHLPLLQHLLSVLWKFLEERKLPAALDKASEGYRNFCISSEDLAHALGFSSAAAMDEFYRISNEKQPEHKWTESWILKRALDRAAEGVKTSDKRLQSITGRMFRLLAEVDDRGNYKRRWTSRREILEVTKDKSAKLEEIDGIIAAFSSPYPFLNAKPGLDGKIDVSHESFIRNWAQFTDWLSNERRLAIAYDMLRKKYLARQRTLAERAKRPFARFWFRPSYGISRDELIQLKDWHESRSENAAWANRYINGLEGEDPESDRRSADDNQAETLNRRLVSFYQLSVLFSYKKAAGWGLTAAIAVGLVILALEFQQRAVSYNREVTSAGVALVSENIRQFSNERSGVNAREINQKLSELTGSGAIVLSAGKSENEWVGRILDWYRALTFRPNDPGAFYYVARSSIDSATRKLLDGAMFPVGASSGNDAFRPKKPNASPLKPKCEEQLGKPLGTVLAKSEEFIVSGAKLALAPLEPEGGKQIAILPTNQGNLVLLLLSNDDDCTVRYLQSLSLPPGELKIDDSLQLIVVKVAGNKPGEPKTWIYRIWWSRPCPLREDTKSPTGGKCAIPFAAEITGPTLAETHFRFVDHNRLEADGAGKKRFELRGDHRLTRVNSADALDAFPKRRPDDPAPRHCTTSGRYAAFIREEDAPGAPKSPNPADAPDPPARTLFVIEEAGPKADCQKILNFNKIPENRVPEKVIATLALGYFPISDIAFLGAQTDRDLPPDYVYLRRGDGGLPVYRIALSPQKIYCLDKNAAAEATRSRFYLNLLASVGLAVEKASTLSEKTVGIPSCPGKWDDVR
jgi:hypothetical protein